MKKVDVENRMECAQKAFSSANIEWIVDKGILFVFFPVGSFLCPYRAIEFIIATSDGIKIVAKKKLNVQWRSTSNTMMITMFS